MTSNDIEGDRGRKTIAIRDWKPPYADRHLGITASFAIAMEEWRAVKRLKCEGDAHEFAEISGRLDSPHTARATLIQDWIGVLIAQEVG